MESWKSSPLILAPFLSSHKVCPAVAIAVIHVVEANGGQQYHVINHIEFSHSEFFFLRLKSPLGFVEQNSKIGNNLVCPIFAKKSPNKIMIDKGLRTIFCRHMDMKHVHGASIFAANIAANFTVCRSKNLPLNLTLKMRITFWTQIQSTHLD